jgi:hypothetical protein
MPLREKATKTTVTPSTNLTDTTGIMLTKFDVPDRKIMFYNVNVQFPRDFNHVSRKARWHDLNEPKYPTSFVDGHAEYFNFSWRKQSGFYPRAPGLHLYRPNSRGMHIFLLRERGMSKQDYLNEWSIDVLGYYQAIRYRKRIMSL